MLTAEHHVHVDAPAHEVFEFLDDPSNHLKITPSLVDVSVVERYPGGGKEVEYTYKLAGIQLSGRLRDAERDPPNRLIQSLSGAIDGTIKYDLSSEGDGTSVSYSVEYELPEAVLSTTVSSILRTYNEQEARSTLANLKAHLDS